MLWLQEQAVHLRDEPVGGLDHHDRDQHGGNQDRSGQPAQGRAAVSWTGGDAAGQALVGGFGMQVRDALAAELAGRVGRENRWPPCCLIAWRDR